jgi:hypothetical protein
MQLCGACGAELIQTEKRASCVYCGTDVAPETPPVESIPNICRACTHPLSPDHDDFGCHIPGCDCTSKERAIMIPEDALPNADKNAKPLSEAAKKLVEQELKKADEIQRARREPWTENENGVAICRACLDSGVAKPGAKTITKGDIAHVITHEGQGHIEVACGDESVCPSCGNAQEHINAVGGRPYRFKDVQGEIVEVRAMTDDDAWVKIGEKMATFPGELRTMGVKMLANAACAFCHGSGTVPDDSGKDLVRPCPDCKGEKKNACPIKPGDYVRHRTFGWSGKVVVLANSTSPVVCWDRQSRPPVGVTTTEDARDLELANATPVKCEGCGKDLIVSHGPECTAWDSYDTGKHWCKECDSTKAEGWPASIANADGSPEAIKAAALKVKDVSAQGPFDQPNRLGCNGCDDIKAPLNKDGYCRQCANEPRHNASGKSGFKAEREKQEGILKGLTDQLHALEAESGAGGRDTDPKRAPILRQIEAAEKAREDAHRKYIAEHEKEQRNAAPDFQAAIAAFEAHCKSCPKCGVCRQAPAGSPEADAKNLCATGSQLLVADLENASACAYCKKPLGADAAICEECGGHVCPSCIEKGKNGRGLCGKCAHGERANAAPKFKPGQMVRVRGESVAIAKDSEPGEKDGLWHYGIVRSDGSRSSAAESEIENADITIPESHLAEDQKSLTTIKKTAEAMLAEDAEAKNANKPQVIQDAPDDFSIVVGGKKVREGLHKDEVEFAMKEVELGNAGDLRGFKAAVKDPTTGKVHTGDSHAQVMEKVLGDAASSRETKRAVMRAVASNDENTGFVDPSGAFITRAEAQAKYGFSRSEEMRERQNSTCPDCKEKMKKSVDSEGQEVEACPRCGGEKMKLSNASSPENCNVAPSTAFQREQLGASRYGSAR